MRVLFTDDGRICIIFDMGDKEKAQLVIQYGIDLYEAEENYDVTALQDILAVLKAAGMVH